MVDYSSVNRAMWDDRAPAHAAAPEYAVEQFVADPDFLSEVVRFDLPRRPRTCNATSAPTPSRSHGSGRG